MFSACQEHKCKARFTQIFEYVCLDFQNSEVEISFFVGRRPCQAFLSQHARQTRISTFDNITIILRLNRKSRMHPRGCFRWGCAAARHSGLIFLYSICICFGDIREAGTRNGALSWRPSSMDFSPLPYTSFINASWEVVPGGLALMFLAVAHAQIRFCGMRYFNEAMVGARCGWSRRTRFAKRSQRLAAPRCECTVPLEIAPRVVSMEPYKHSFRRYIENACSSLIFFLTQYFPKLRPDGIPSLSLRERRHCFLQQEKALTRRFSRTRQQRSGDAN